MRSDPHDPESDRRLVELAYDLLNGVAAVRARAQLTRRRIARVDALSRDHIDADLAQIEAQTQRLVELVDPLHRGNRRAPISCANRSPGSG